MWRQSLMTVRPSKVPALPSMLPELHFTLPGIDEIEEKHMKSQLWLLSSQLDRSVLLPSSDISLPVAFIRSNYFSRFLASKKPKDNLYKRIQSSSLSLVRVAHALKMLNVTNEEVENDNALMFLPPSGLLDTIRLKQELGSSLSQTRKTWRSQPIRGKTIRRYLDEFASTLRLFGFDDSFISDLELEACRKGVSLRTLNELLAQPLLHTLFPNSLNPKLQALFDRLSRTRKFSITEKAVVRNFYLWSKVLNVDVEHPVAFRAIWITCPLESLITLNGHYEATKVMKLYLFKSYMKTSVSGELMEKSSFCSLFAQNNLHLWLSPSTKFPSSLRRQVLEAIGMSEMEIRNVLLSKNKSISAVKGAMVQSGRNVLYYSAPNYVDVMQHRLRIARANRDVLGLTTGEELFAAIARWDTVLEAVRDASEIAVNSEEHAPSSSLSSPSPSPPTLGSFVRLKVLVSKDSFRVRLLDSFARKLRESANIKLLQHCFPEHMTIERKHQLLANLPNLVFVSLVRVENNVRLMRERGFSDASIIDACAILFYDTQRLSSLLDNTDFGGFDTESKKLQLLLYHVEAEHEFSGEGVLDQPLQRVTQELWDELEDQLSYIRPGHESRRGANTLKVVPDVSAYELKSGSKRVADDKMVFKNDSS